MHGKRTTLLRAYWLDIRHLEFSGGGVDAVSQLGCVDYLLNTVGILRAGQLTSVSGSSAGAFIAATLALSNFDVPAIALEISSMDLPELSFEVLTSIGRKTRALVSKRDGQRTLRRIIASLCGNENIRLGDLPKFSPVKIEIRSHDLISGRGVILDHETEPRMLLVDALWASMAVPCAMEAVAWGKMYLVDGGISSNFDVRPRAGQAYNHTHGFRVLRRPGLTRGGLSYILKRLQARQNPGVAEAALENIVVAAGCLLDASSTDSSDRSLNVTELPSHSSLIGGMRKACDEGIRIETLLRRGREAQQVWGARYFASAAVLALGLHESQ